MTNKETTEEKAIRLTRENHEPHCIPTRTKTVWAAIRDGMIRVQVYNDDIESIYPVKDYCVAL